MATAKRRKPASTTKRKTGAAKKRKKPASSASKITVKGVNGKKATFSKSSCHTSKSAAKKQAESIRKQGVRAMLKEGADGTVCVFKGPRMTDTGRKIYQRTHKRA